MLPYTLLEPPRGRMESPFVLAVEPVDALLAIDVGNTRIGFGIWDFDGLHDARRIAVDRPDQWEVALAETWGTIADRHRALVLGSVNPEGTPGGQESVKD